MKKQHLKNLKLNKKTIVKFEKETITGGMFTLALSCHCASSLVPLECIFACATQKTVCASIEC